MENSSVESLREQIVQVAVASQRFLPKKAITRIDELIAVHDSALLDKVLAQKKLYPSPLKGDESEYEAVPVAEIAKLRKGEA